ncbi:MAG: hypothetical protein WCJ56_11150, partial [bacterium]
HQQYDHHHSNRCGQTQPIDLLVFVPGIYACLLPTNIFYLGTSVPELVYKHHPATSQPIFVGNSPGIYAGGLKAAIILSTELVT